MNNQKHDFEVYLMEYYAKNVYYEWSLESMYCNQSEKWYDLIWINTIEGDVFKQDL